MTGVKSRKAETSAIENRSKTLGISMLATFLLLAGLMVVPSPYVVKSPGPTRDTLGEVNAEKLINIDDETYESTGELRLTTVGVAGGPGYRVNFAQVLRGWLDKSRAVYPVETVYPKNVSQEEIDKASQAEMVSSQEEATYAALTQLGYDVPTEVKVQEVLQGSPLVGMLEQGDQMVTLNDAAITSYNQLLSTLDEIAPESQVTLGILRDGQQKSFTVKTLSNETKDASGKVTGKGSRLGVALKLDFDFPVDVNIRIEDIGGPSAGTMFALGIIEKLTPGDQTNGHIIAGTGTIDTQGKVGAIGGIQQKMYGAVRDGAQFFLAPESNCDEVVGSVPDGLQVVKVSTLADAWTAVEKIGSDNAVNLPTCSAK